MKAVVAGASGGIGQPLSLLLKLCPLIDDLALYDVVNSPGVAVDLSHISTPAKVTGYLPNGKEDAFSGADIVIIPAGIPRKPEMTRDQLFGINAGIVKDLVEACAKFCPDAFILIISNPVNSTVPIAAQTLKVNGCLNPKKLFGVTTLDVVRAETFLAELCGISVPSKITVPVIGGHSGDTIVPLLSQSSTKVDISEKDRNAMIKRIQFGGDEVVKAKNGAGSATLSMAYAGFRFAEKVMKAAKGEEGIVEPAFVCLEEIEGCDPIKKQSKCSYFAIPVELGPLGIIRVTDSIEKADDSEKALLSQCYQSLRESIEKGENFVKSAQK